MILVGLVTYTNTTQCLTCNVSIMWYTIHLWPISFQSHCIFGILQSFSISAQLSVSCWPVAIEIIVAMVQFFGWCELINGLCEFSIISFNIRELNFSGTLSCYCCCCPDGVVAMTTIATVQPLPSCLVASVISQALPWQCFPIW